MPRLRQIGARAALVASLVVCIAAAGLWCTGPHEWSWQDEAGTHGFYVAGGQAGYVRNWPYRTILGGPEGPRGIEGVTFRFPLFFLIFITGVPPAAWCFNRLRPRYRGS